MLLPKSPVRCRVNCSQTGTATSGRADRLKEGRLPFLVLAKRVNWLNSLIDGSRGLENTGKDCFKDSVQIVDFFHAMEHAGRAIPSRFDHFKQRVPNVRPER